MTSESVDLKEAEELAQALGEAIANGEKDEASRLSQRLSELAVRVNVTVDHRAYPRDSIKLKVGVQDGGSVIEVPVTVDVSTDMRIAQLKDKFSHDYGFNATLQRWVIGKRLAADGDTLYSHGIRKSGDQAFLFILSSQALARELEQRQDQQRQDQQRHIDGKAEHILKARGLGPNAMAMPPPKAPLLPPVAVKAGWICGACTFLNKPTRPGCEVCSADRPEGYQVPADHQPDPEELQRMLLERQATNNYTNVLLAEKQQSVLNFQQLLQTEEQGIVPCTTALECSICMDEVQPGECATLRECLHSFCRECLRGTIVNSQDAEVSCPFGGDYTCDKKLQDREIKALLTEEEHQRFLELRLKIAESRQRNSFHCQTLNCRGWCVYEDEVNEFPCDICLKTNCILCKAIHEDMNCKEYQDDLRIRAGNDIAAQKTKEMMETLLQNGEAMKCPGCDVVIQKKNGCDWLCCLMCKTEICWVTKQARWGPKGVGDSSGGCACRVNNVLCHPNCQNCH